MHFSAMRNVSREVYFTLFLITADRQDARVFFNKFPTAGSVPEGHFRTLIKRRPTAAQATVKQELFIRLYLWAILWELFQKLSCRNAL